jgi:hypothetical protein
MISFASNSTTPASSSVTLQLRQFQPNYRLNKACPRLPLPEGGRGCRAAERGGREPFVFGHSQCLI